MTVPAHAFANGIISTGSPPDETRCPITGRPFEVGSGAWSHAEQTALFVQQAADAADMPVEGEVDQESGKAFEVGHGALSKTRQREIFKRQMAKEGQPLLRDVVINGPGAIDHMSTAEEREFRAAAQALADIPARGRA